LVLLTSAPAMRARACRPAGSGVLHRWRGRV